ncbi:MAG: transposase [bacterium]
MEGINKRRKFDKQFKLDAVRLVTEGGRKAADVARDLGVDPNTIYNWKRDFGAHGNNSFPGNGRVMPQEEECRRLQREVATLREENQILKKAMGYFTKHGK